MPAVFCYRLTVPQDAIDGNRHVNNVEYIRWMQDAATAHSDAQGWDEARYRRAGFVWLVRSHRIEYLRPAFAGDEVTVRTWVHDMRKFRSLRKFSIERSSDGVVLARAETDWVFTDIASGRPRPIDPEVEEAFEIVEEA